MTDTVLRPAHYLQGSHECIDEIKAMLTPCEFQGFIKGNIIKYRYRANLKNGIEDLEKADNYAYYLINGHFKDKDIKPKNGEKDDSPNDNSNDDPMSNVFRHIVDNPNKLLSKLEKLAQVLEHTRFRDTYKGKKITNDKDLLSFNLFDTLKQVMPIAELVAGMYRQKDINKDTVVTLNYISKHMSTGTEIKYKHNPNVSDTATIVFKDKSKLRLKVPSGCDIADIFKPDTITQWRDICTVKE